MVVREQEYDLIRGTSEIVDHSHSATLTTFSSRYSPTELPTSRCANNDVAGSWVDQQILLHLLIVFILKELGYQFSKHLRLDEGEFHAGSLRQ